jgi:hypothetical protein
MKKLMLPELPARSLRMLNLILPIKKRRGLLVRAGASIIYRNVKTEEKILDS